MVSVSPSRLNASSGRSQSYRSSPTQRRTTRTPSRRRGSDPRSRLPSVSRSGCERPCRVMSDAERASIWGNRLDAPSLSGGRKQSGRLALDPPGARASSSAPWVTPPIASGLSRAFGPGGGRLLGLADIGRLHASAYAGVPAAYGRLSPLGEPAAVFARRIRWSLQGTRPTVAVETLRAKWVPGAHVIYVGKADVAQRRMREFGQAPPRRRGVHRSPVGSCQRIRSPTSRSSGPETEHNHPAGSAEGGSGPEHVSAARLGSVAPDGGDLAAAAALAAAHEQCAATVVEVRLVEGERLVDPKSRSPLHDDQAAQPAAMAPVTGRAHDRDDLLDGRRICRVAVSLVAWWAAGVESRHRRRQSPATGGVEQQLGHDPSSSSITSRELHERMAGGPHRSRRRPPRAASRVNDSPGIESGAIGSHGIGAVTRALLSCTVRERGGAQSGPGARPLIVRSRRAPDPTLGHSHAGRKRARGALLSAQGKESGLHRSRTRGATRTGPRAIGQLLRPTRGKTTSRKTRGMAQSVGRPADRLEAVSESCRRCAASIPTARRRAPAPRGSAAFVEKRPY
jgi:hypothetical protein